MTMRKLRLRFWMLAMDVAYWLRADELYMYCVGKAGDATDWGEGAKRGDGEPF